MRSRRFRDTLDEIGLSAAEAAELFGVAVQTLRSMRLDPDTAGYRTPPSGWERRLAGVARARSRALARLADHLNKAASTKTRRR